MTSRRNEVPAAASAASNSAGHVSGLMFLTPSAVPPCDSYSSTRVNGLTSALSSAAALPGASWRMLNVANTRCATSGCSSSRAASSRGGFRHSSVVAPTSNTGAGVSAAVSPGKSFADAQPARTRVGPAGAGRAALARDAHGTPRAARTPMASELFAAVNP
jgi:hypothetical protein